MQGAHREQSVCRSGCRGWPSGATYLRRMTPVWSWGGALAGWGLNVQRPASELDFLFRWFIGRATSHRNQAKYIRARNDPASSWSKKRLSSDASWLSQVLSTISPPAVATGSLCSSSQRKMDTLLKRKYVGHITNYPQIPALYLPGSSMEVF